MLIFFFTQLLIYGASATISIIDKGIVPLEKDSVGIQFFIDIENVNRDETCLVRTWTKRCCLTDSQKEDCNIMQVFGDQQEVIRPRDRKILSFVYPTVLQHDQLGYCDFVLSHKCGRDRYKRKLVDVQLDTRIPHELEIPFILGNYIANKRKTTCTSIDEDALNFCAPVNCDQKYSEARPFFDSQHSKCTKAAVCIATSKKELPDIVYVPNSNVCRDLNYPLKVEDIIEITKGAIVTVDPTTPKSIMKLEVYSNCTTISQNLLMLWDLLIGKFPPRQLIDKSDYYYFLKTAVLGIIRYIIITCVTLLVGLILCYVGLWLYTFDYEGYFNNAKRRFKKKRFAEKFCNDSPVNKSVKHDLLKEVITRDIPMELKGSLINICDRVSREVRWKKRYRSDEIGSQYSLQQQCSCSSESSSSSDEGECSKLLN